MSLPSLRACILPSFHLFIHSFTYSLTHRSFSSSFSLIPLPLLFPFYCCSLSIAVPLPLLVPSLFFPASPPHCLPCSPSECATSTPHSSPALFPYILAQQALSENRHCSPAPITTTAPHPHASFHPCSTHYAGGRLGLWTRLRGHDCQRLGRTSLVGGSHSSLLWYDRHLLCLDTVTFYLSASQSLTEPSWTRWLTVDSRVCVDNRSGIPPSQALH